MIRGPKIKMTLYRYSTVPDGGGGLTKTWTNVDTLTGVLTFVWANEGVMLDRERLENRYQFWVEYRSDLSDMSTKDELRRTGVTQPYRIVDVDNVLEQNKIFKIDLVQTK